MTYFADLTTYAYGEREFARQGTLSIGWLSRARRFLRAEPPDDLLEELWSLCSVSVANSRGVHACELCPNGHKYISERNGRRLFLGGGEIRVFTGTNRIYAAPNLIYHYVAVHHYSPPEEFVEAVLHGPNPPSEQYFDRLKEVKLSWSVTPDGSGMRNFRDLLTQDG